MNPATSFGLGGLMFATGIGIPIMAAISAGLSARIGNPNAAGFILFLVAAAVACIAMLVTSQTHGLPSLSRLASVPPQYFTGGLFVAFYVLSITYCAPRIGLGNAVMLVLLGQLVAAAAIDHYALFGAIRSAMTWQRAGGLALMAIGVVLARKVV